MKTIVSRSPAMVRRPYRNAAAQVTVIVPIIVAWIVQWYWKVPRRRNRRVNEAPGESVRSHRPSFDVVVWVLSPRFTHFTLVPRSTVIDAGRKLLSMTRTRARWVVPVT